MDFLKVRELKFQKNIERENNIVGRNKIEDNKNERSKEFNNKIDKRKKVSKFFIQCLRIDIYFIINIVFITVI